LHGPPYGPNRLSSAGTGDRRRRVRVFWPATRSHLEVQRTAHLVADDEGHGVGVTEKPAQGSDSGQLEALQRDPLGLSNIHEYTGRGRPVCTEQNVVQSLPPERRSAREVSAAGECRGRLPG